MGGSICGRGLSFENVLKNNLKNNLEPRITPDIPGHFTTYDSHGIRIYRFIRDRVQVVVGRLQINELVLIIITGGELGTHGVFYHTIEIGSHSMSTHFSVNYARNAKWNKVSVNVLKTLLYNFRTIVPRRVGIEYNKRVFKECTKVKRHSKLVILMFLQRIVGRQLSDPLLSL